MVPSAQGTHALAFSVLEKVPAAQTWHKRSLVAEPPEATIEPGAHFVHSVQADALVVAEKEPDAQGAHPRSPLELPCGLTYCPGEQVVLHDWQEPALVAVE